LATAPVPCFYADWAEVPLPEGHRFPMHKYRTTREQLEEDASLRGRLDLRPSPLVALADVLRVHCPRYVDRVLTGALSAEEQRTVGFPWSEEHVQRSLASTGGTVAAMHLVLGGTHRCALQLAGGTHHAFRDRGEGFCVFNDMAVAAAAALVRGRGNVRLCVRALRMPLAPRRMRMA
jgi:acetoin utilization deacetylase AcuC-like enzyme